jgi:class 3 adenylate cyclase/tetratricopeptide (TPR) repeat protein
VAACPSCGKEVPGEFPFCPYCAAPLEQPRAPAAEERKVVTVLFCDLVGFTASADNADPEDVRARIRPYHSRLRQVIESYSGTVEKFVGDAVMAVFGAPVAHEDDAERAVRCGLEILEAIDELNEADPGLELQVRIGINTGEAVVALGARPEHGEGFVTGDVVNTAARLQSAAPVGAIAVGELTYRTTERAFEYEELAPVDLKGKADYVPIWQAHAVRARFGADADHTRKTPLVGRELERNLLEGAAERAVRDSSVQLVTIVGEAGVGKSRLAAELFGYIDDRPGLITWRQGRCLPYGEGIAFWALGEIVKAQAGILESDSPEQAAAKLEGAVLADDPDREWLRARLGPLVGVEAEPVAHEESFAAWRLFLESLAASRPTVLVFEDLHWADEALLAFLEHLAEWSEGVPLVLVCIARPEFAERHAHFGAAARNAQAINLGPLSAEETARLVALLLERAVLPAETQQLLLDRAGGNPLYAEEFVRMLADRGALSGALEDVPFPDSVQALIAARLDTLSVERKALLQDASVIGKVFWTGALAAMDARGREDVEQALHELSRRELVRPIRRSSMAGEVEYAFWHLLVRDVCYAQIPRAARADKHRAAARWIAEQAGDRAEDLAAVVAHHYMQALELTQASGGDADVELEQEALRFVVLAGDRAVGLDVDEAEAHYARALDLLPHDHPERARLLARSAVAAHHAGRLKEAAATLDEAIAELKQQGLDLETGRALIALTSVLYRLGDPREIKVLEEGIELLEAQPGSELVDAYAEMAGTKMVQGVYNDAIEWSERALELAEQLELDQPARAVGFRGYARTALGELGGVEDMRTSLALATERGLGRDAAVQHNNLALATLAFEGPAPALDAFRAGIDFTERRGISEFTSGLAASSLDCLLMLGEWDEAVAVADQLERGSQTSGSTLDLLKARACGAWINAYRGVILPESAEQGFLVEPAREAKSSEHIAIAFTVAALVAFLGRRHDQAEALLDECAHFPHVVETVEFGAFFPEFVRVAVGCELIELCERTAGAMPRITPLGDHALTAAGAVLAEARGDYERGALGYAEAERRWTTFGAAFERAHALLGRTPDYALATVRSCMPAS